MVDSSLKYAVIWGKVLLRVKEAHGGQELLDHGEYRFPGDLAGTPSIPARREGLQAFEFCAEPVECRLGADLVRAADTGTAFRKRAGRTGCSKDTEIILLLSGGFPGSDL